ncbi:MAG: dynamin family protein [Oscillospiraceae bacterium]|nr:dynamin family protein [Oscillospiraceae bacterium]
MEKEMLQLQQYISIHPVIDIKEKFRIAYISLLKYICEKHSKQDQWSQSMILLMKEQMMLTRDFLHLEIDEKNRIKEQGKVSILLKYKLHKYRYNILTDCLFISAFNDKQKGKEILNDMCCLYPRSAKELTRLFDCFYKVDNEIIKNRYISLYDIFSIIDKNRKFLSIPEKRIMITANMSAGKSTLLNALAGKKVNKTQNDTCTAKIHYLLNKAGEDTFSYELDHDLELNATYEILMDDNEDNISSEIVVGTRFRSLSEIENRVCFIDTPGVNSSQNKEHKELTNEVISDDNCDLLIFLLNGENIGSDDDAKHLRYVAENYHGDIIFLINKLDKFKKDIDSVSETLKNAHDDLMKMGYNDPKVYPISAYAAYLAKMVIYGEKLTEDEEDDLNFRKRKLSKEEFQYYRYYDVEAPLIDETKEDEVLLRNSGILSLEKIIY